MCASVMSQIPIIYGLHTSWRGTLYHTTASTELSPLQDSHLVEISPAALSLCLSLPYCSNPDNPLTRAHTLRTLSIPPSATAASLWWASTNSRKATSWPALPSCPPATAMRWAQLATTSAGSYRRYRPAHCWMVLRCARHAAMPEQMVAIAIGATSEVFWQEPLAFDRWMHGGATGSM